MWDKLINEGPHWGFSQRFQNRLTAMLVMGLFVSVRAWCLGTLQIGDVTVENNLVIVPVLLGGDASGSVASLNFHLNYDPVALQPIQVAPGSVAAQADKQVAFNVPAPGQSVIVMFGLNQTTCSGGEVARIVMKRDAEAGSAQWALGLSNQTLSDVQGAVIESRVLPFTPEPDDTDNEDPDPDDENEPKPEEPERPQAEAPQRPPGITDPARGDVPAQAAVNPPRTTVVHTDASAGADAKKEIEDALRGAAQARSAIATPKVNGGELRDAPEAPDGAETGDRSEERTDTMNVAQVGEAQTPSQTSDDKTIEKGITESSDASGTAKNAVPTRRSGGKTLVVGGALAVLATGILAFALLNRR